MNRCLAAVTVLFVSLASLSCGSSHRQLQSITIKATFVNGSQFRLVATGNYSAAPLTVMPLPVFWSETPPPPNYSLSVQPFVIDCAVANPGPWIAMAPADPKAPSSGSISTTKMISEPTGCASGN
jgi:hypothetical protein